MPYRFTCPHCRAETLVDEKYSGTRGPCRQCGRLVLIPQFASAVEDPEERAAPAPRRVGRGVPRYAWVAGLLVLVIAMGGYAAVTQLRPALSRLRTSAARGGCLNNVQQIALALNEYAADYGTYPPPTIYDPSGQPMHSWRVLILPYLGYDGLYREYDLSEPWDSAGNTMLTGRLPTEYNCPAAPAYGFGSVNYMLITGPGTLFPGSGPLGPDEVTDGLEQTLLVVEVDSSGGPARAWNEPGDLDITRMQMAVGGTPGVEIGGEHPGGASVATCDGRVHVLRSSQPAGTVRALVTPRGGEALPDDVLD